MDVYLGFMVLEGLLAAVVVALNLLVCATVFLHKELRCTTNYLIVCLALADFGVGAFAIPFSMVLSMEYTLCFYACLFLNCFPLVTTQFSVLLLLVIAVNAHLKIKLPDSYSRYVKTGGMAIVVALCWLLALLIGLSPMMGWNRLHPYVETTGNKTLVASFPSERTAVVVITYNMPHGSLLSDVDPGQQQKNFSCNEIHDKYLVRCSFTSIFTPEYLVYFVFFTCTLVPLATMLGIYANLFRVVRSHFRSQTLWPMKRKELHMARTLFLLVGVFCICWFPLHVISCIQLLCPSCQRYESLERLAVLFSHLNSLANPLVYALRKKDFGMALRSVFLYRVLHWPRLKAICCPNSKVHPQA